MYTRDQASQIKQEFWTTFGRYLSPHLSSEGLKINWINYKTGVRDVVFRMDADKTRAWIAIEINHKDTDLQELVYGQFEEYKELLHNSLEEEWEWQPLTCDVYGRTVSRVIRVKEDVNIFDKTTWPEIISFLKPRIIALDEFWESVKVMF